MFISITITHIIIHFNLSRVDRDLDLWWVFDSHDNVPDDGCVKSRVGDLTGDIGLMVIHLGCQVQTALDGH